MVVSDPTKATKAHAAHTRPGTTKHTIYINIIYHFTKRNIIISKQKNTRKTAKYPLNVNEMLKIRENQRFLKNNQRFILPFQIFTLSLQQIKEG